MRKKIVAIILIVGIAFVLSGVYFYKKTHNIKTLPGITSSIAKDLYNPIGNVVAGNPNGAVTMVLFFGYNCECCRKYFPIEQQFIKTHPNLRMVFKEYLVFGNLSKPAAYAALAANLQGKYLVMHDAMMSATGVLKDEKIIKIARALNINVPLLLKDMRSPTIKEQIQKNTQLSKKIDIPGAPTALFIKTTDAQSPILSGQIKPYILVGNFNRKNLNAIYNAAEQQ